MACTSSTSSAGIDHLSNPGGGCSTGFVTAKAQEDKPRPTAKRSKPRSSPTGPALPVRRPAPHRPLLRRHTHGDKERGEGRGQPRHLHRLHQREPGWLHLRLMAARLRRRQGQRSSIASLHNELGPAIFQRLPRTYLERYRWRIATPAEFRALAEEMSGKDLGALFGK